MDTLPKISNTEIKKKIRTAIGVLFKNDVWLLLTDGSERSITHKLAEYLQVLFPDYNVDCEYNRNLLDNIKEIHPLRKELEDKGLLTKKEKQNATLLEKKLLERAVFPDIIIHLRGMHKYNLCIIEVKKNTSSVSCVYDKIKLKYLTGNEFNYQLGIFLKIEIKGKEPLNYSYSIEEIDKNSIIL